MDKYQIMIVGDNILEGIMELTESEIAAFCKVVDALKPDGRWVPSIHIRNLSEEERQAKAAEEFLKKENERIAEEMRREDEKHQKAFAEECAHLGKYTISSKYPDLLKKIFI